ncbi:hypothetical protein [Dinghuibacter silviterrae]|uniref:Lipocalin-like protein n=1 Tax=Dinghuibacter silviterrae TaxID=1539049 RepID=A0A4V3GLJ6_9BACT|nr:hypothetical protein [Dinghuibacter silviterrae]TDW99792.1 hypothetical protein EDB95_0803 [Dinghuibacter silviterrae]
MKRLILLAAITFTACHKHVALAPLSSTGQTVNDSSIYGEWTFSYRSIQGFWNFWTFEPAGSVVKLGLEPNGIYYTKLNGKIVDSSTYKVTTVTYPAVIDTDYQFNNEAQTGDFITTSGQLSFAGDTLYLRDAFISPEGETFFVFYR